MQVSDRMPEAKRIVLARHGPVSASLRTRIAGRQFAEFVDEWQASGIASTAIPSSESSSLAQAAAILVTSDLLRSMQSARLLAPNKPTMSDSVFREAQVPATFRSSVVLRRSTWIVMARFLWLCRSWPGIESRFAARERAGDAARRLEQLVDEYGSVFLVGHGYFNLLIARELRGRGWNGPRHPATRNWGTSTYLQSTTSKQSASR
jgi:broad specificity phosphatase PhoE